MAGVRMSSSRWTLLMIMLSPLRISAVQCARNALGKTRREVKRTQPPRSLESLHSTDRHRRIVLPSVSSASHARRFIWFVRGGDGGSGGAAGTDQGSAPIPASRRVIAATSPWAASTDAAGGATVDVAQKRTYQPKVLSKHDVSVCSVRGYRHYMEDDFIAQHDFCAVLDGHGGPAVSRYLRQNLYAELQAALPRAKEHLQREEEAEAARKQQKLDVSNNTTNASITPDRHTNHTSSANPTTTIASRYTTADHYELALRHALAKVDAEVTRIAHWSFQGSTCVCVYFCHDVLICANIGDSRAVLSRNGRPLQLSRDHKPGDPDEYARIHQVGGMVRWCGDRSPWTGEPIVGRGVYRVNGNLAVSRAIGDRAERPAMSAEPEVSWTRLQEDNHTDDFVVLATDGLWDVMSSLDVVSFVQHLVANTNDDDTFDKTSIATLLVEEALRRGSMDNITVLLVWLTGNNGNESASSSGDAPPAGTTELTGG